MQASYQQITFSDADVVNPGDFIPQGEYNPRKVRPFLLHDHGFVIAVVFAACTQDALDEAADADKLDRYLIDLNDPSDRVDYLVKDKVTPGYDPDVPEYVDAAGGEYWWANDGPAFLGNASEPFDIESLDVIELPNPPFSFAALFNAHQKTT